MQIVGAGVGHRHSPGPLLFSGLDFELVPGRIVAVVGPSGSGKSTLLSLIAGFRQPAQGVIVRDGVTRHGWVLQNPIGAPRRTAIDHVVQPLLFRGARRRDAIETGQALLTRFGLQKVADREFRMLSGGEAQRLSFARSVAAAPDVLLLDEPTAQLDQSSAAAIRAVIHELADEHRIVALATHDMALSAECDEVLDLAQDHASL